MGTTPLTNVELGRRLGVGHSMASRLRHGKRAPGIAVMKKMAEEFDIPWADVCDARAKGAEATGQLIREHAGTPGAPEDRDPVAA